MNAPFHARAGLRDPFSAYVCDDATADMLRPVAVEHGWSPEKVNKGGLRNAVQSLSVSASPNILFVDLSESGDPLPGVKAVDAYRSATPTGKGGLQSVSPKGGN